MTRMYVQREIEKEFTRLMAKHFFHHHRILASCVYCDTIKLDDETFENAGFLCLFQNIFIASYTHKFREMRLMYKKLLDVE